MTKGPSKEGKIGKKQQQEKNTSSSQSEHSAAQESVPPPSSGSFLSAIKNRIFGISAQSPSSSQPTSSPQQTTATPQPNKSKKRKRKSTQTDPAAQHQPDASNTPVVERSIPDGSGKRKKRRRRHTNESNDVEQTPNQFEQTGSNSHQKRKYQGQPEPEPSQELTSQSSVNRAPPPTSETHTPAPIAAPFSDAPTQATHVPKPKKKSQKVHKEDQRLDTTASSALGSSQPSQRSTSNGSGNTPAHPPPDEPETGTQNANENSGKNSTSTQEQQPPSSTATVEIRPVANSAATSSKKRKGHAREEEENGSQDEEEPGHRVRRGRPRKSDKERVEEIIRDGGTGRRLPNAAILNQFFLSTQHLNLLEKHIGLKYIKGPFKKAEDDKLKDFVEDYCRRAQLNIDGFRALLFEDKTLRQGSFWIDITSQLQDRPVISVYHHIRRMFHATARQGMWTSGEDEKLRELVMSYGRAWEKIGKKMGSRASFDCKDRWDNHLRFNEDSELVKRLGEWSQDEVERLKVAVRAAEEEMHQPAAKGLMLWSEVAEKVGTRNRQQCAAKWMEDVDPRMRAEEDGTVKPRRWKRKKHTLELLLQIRACTVADEDDIPWKMIHRKSAAFEYFPLSKLQKQWRRIKNKVYDEAEDPDVLTLSDILDRGIEAKMIKRREPRAVRRQRAEDGQPQLDEFVVGGGLKRKPKEFKSEAFIESDVDDA